MNRMNSGIYFFPSRQYVLPLLAVCDSADAPTKLLVTGGESGEIMELHKHNYKSRWDKAVRCLAKMVGKEEAETIDEVIAQLAYVLKHGSCLEAAKAIVMAVFAGWAHCEMHEHETEDE